MKKLNIKIPLTLILISIFSCNFNVGNDYAATNDKINSMEFVCKHTENILKMIQNDPWLNSRSHILRFEDFVSNKEKEVSQILTHAGLRSDARVNEYVEKVQIDPKVTNSWKENLQSRKSSKNFSS